MTVPIKKSSSNVYLLTTEHSEKPSFTSSSLKINDTKLIFVYVHLSKRITYSYSFERIYVRQTLRRMKLTFSWKPPKSEAIFPPFLKPLTSNGQQASYVVNFQPESASLRRAKTWKWSVLQHYLTVSSNSLPPPYSFCSFSPKPSNASTSTFYVHGTWDAQNFQPSRVSLLFWIQQFLSGSEWEHRIL